MREILDVAVQMATRVGEIQRDRFAEPRTIETKSTAIDLVTDVDRACETLADGILRERRPDDGFLGEEGTSREGTTGLRWVIDPLDGTTNYAHGFPHFAVSIGVESVGERVVGVIYDPLKDELFSAVRGEGAELNGAPIGVSQTEDLTRGLLATGFAYNVHRAENAPLEIFGRFIRRARAVRRAGSAALDLAYVACGRFDGFWEGDLHPWDVAAGLLIVEEAGGCTSSFDGGPAPASGSDVVASNGTLHAELLRVISGP